MDDLSVVNRAPGFFDEADEVHISVAFTWDLPVAERLEHEWKHVAPVKVGGPALNEKGGDFIPGKYVKDGYVITSRGCPNKCWFCSVWRREGAEIRELPVSEGWNVLDDNLLACSDDHIKSVFLMLSKQKKKPEFTGGIEAKRLKQWHAEEIKKLRPSQIFFAYDTPDDLEPLIEARKTLREAGFSDTSHCLRCYVLIGHPKDTIEEAENRLNKTMEIGYGPMAMLWRSGDINYTPDRKWKSFQRLWARPSIIYSRRDK